MSFYVDQSINSFRTCKTTEYLVVGKVKWYTLEENNIELRESWKLQTFKTADRLCKKNNVILLTVEKSQEVMEIINQIVNKDEWFRIEGTMVNGNWVDSNGNPIDVSGISISKSGEGFNLAINPSTGR